MDDQPNDPNDPSMVQFRLDVPAPAIAPEDVGTPMFKNALSSIRSELLAIDEKRLVPVNVDVAYATHVVLGAAPDLRAFRPAMLEWFGEEMACKVDRLELLARALGEAHTQHVMMAAAVNLQPLAEEVADVRTALLAEVRSLAARRLVPMRALGNLRGGTGFNNLGFDVLQLVAFLYQHWSRIEAVTGYEVADLVRSESLANELITSFARRQLGSTTPAGELRQRAFTLLAETYDDVQRMVGFLRWKEGDAGRIAPSWYRGGRRAQRGTIDSELVDGALPENGAEPSDDESEETDVPPGMPGARPFGAS